MSRTVKTTTYRSNNVEELGMSILEIETSKGTTVELWIDESEGGEAHEMDWTYIDDFDSKEDAFEFIESAYGPVTELKN